MNTDIIPPFAAQLIARQSAIEIKLTELESIINKAERTTMGLTLDASKTVEWKEAKKQHSIYWNAYRKINTALSKTRTLIGFEAINGKRVAIYKYK